MNRKQPTVARKHERPPSKSRHGARTAVWKSKVRSARRQQPLHSVEQLAPAERPDQHGVVQRPGAFGITSRRIYNYKCSRIAA
jgi:hypothetical protein